MRAAAAMPAGPAPISDASAMMIAHGAAVLIIKFNTAQRTIRCIESIRRGSTLPRRIWMLDNDFQKEDFEICRPKSVRWRWMASS